MGQKQHGFSLLEISIVLALIGLLAGIVLVGQGFIRRHELRSVILDANAYTTAIYQFKAKYQALPGDMINAVEIWGKADGDANLGTNCVDPNTNASTGKPTCNGDGDLMVEGGTGCEDYRAWQQLAAGEFIDGQFTGVSGLALCAANSLPEVNSPKSKMNNTTFALSTFNSASNGVVVGDAVLYDGNYKNALVFGLIRPNNYPINAALTPIAAREVDQKVDDGFPALGAIRSVKPASTATPDCTTAGAAYKESFRDPACALIFTNEYMGNKE
jgi:prepilin-type N-terminal cleavage/methylation domain-containing protein